MARSRSRSREQKTLGLWVERSADDPRHWAVAEIFAEPRSPRKAMHAGLFCAASEYRGPDLILPAVETPAPFVTHRTNFTMVLRSPFLRRCDARDVIFY